MRCNHCTDAPCVEIYGDIAVDTNKSHEIFKEWLAMTRSAPGPNGERRPLWFKRAFTPDKTEGGCYYITDDDRKRVIFTHTVTQSHGVSV